MTLDETFKAAKAGDLTNDTTYKVGEISRKTGLQKQPDGSWAPPKTGAKKPLTRADNTILGGQAGRTLNNNVQAAGPERDVSAENRAYHEKVEKERADRNARADSKASAARQEAEERHLSGVEMKDFFLAKTYEGTSVAMAQRGLEAQGFELLEANDGVNVYERPEGGRITMKLEGNKIKSADYKTPAETAAEGRAGNEPKPLPAASSKKDYTQKAPGPMQNAVSYLNNKTENGADIDEFLDNNGFYSTSNERRIKMADGTMYEIDFKNDDGEKVTRRLMKYDGDPDRQNTKLIYKSSDNGDTPAASSEGESSPGSVKINNDSVEVNGVKIPKAKIRVGGINPEVPVGVMTIESGPDKGSRIMGSYSIKEARRHYQKQGARFTVRREEWGAAEIYETVEGDEAGETWFFNTYKDQLAEAAKGATSDAAYTAESVNAPRENLERKLTGDCKIKIRK